MTVQVVAGAVIGAGRAGVGGAHRVVHVLQRDAGAEQLGREAWRRLCGLM